MVGAPVQRSLINGRAMVGCIRAVRNGAKMPDRIRIIETPRAHHGGFLFFENRVQIQLALRRL